MKQCCVIARVFILISLLTVVTGLQPAAADSLSPQNTINVTTFIDEHNDTTTGCSLREAITAANYQSPFGGCLAGPGNNIIQLPAGTYLLTRPEAYEESNETGDLNITSEVSLIGTGSVTIDAGGDGGILDRVIQNNVGGTLTLNNLTITGGRASSSDQDGGGIFNAGLLSLINVIVNDNHAGDGDPGGNGGGIFNYVNTTLNITNSIINNNRAGTSSAGPTGGSGGGIFMNSGTSLSITNSSITNNIAGAGDTGNGGTGGGIFFNSTSETPITGSTISGNTAGSSSGSAGGVGGGIYAGTSLTLLNSTISGNTTGSTSSSSAAPGYGGGIFTNASTLIRYTTIYNNHVGAGTYPAAGGGIYRNVGSITLGASIIAGNTTNSAGISPDCFSAVDVISEDYNLVENITGCTFSGPTGHSFLGIPGILLYPLGNNGGGTQTHALPRLSLAIDRIPQGVEYCGVPDISTDQRGWVRPSDGNGSGSKECDMGAYEYHTPSIFLPLIKK